MCIWPLLNLMMPEEPVLHAWTLCRRWEDEHSSSKHGSECHPQFWVRQKGQVSAGRGCAAGGLYPSAWLVGFSISGEGMGQGNQLIMMMMIDWTGLHFSHREAMLTSSKCSTSKCVRHSLLGKWSLQEQHEDVYGKPHWTGRWCTYVITEVIVWVEYKS